MKTPPRFSISTLLLVATVTAFSIAYYISADTYEIGARVFVHSPFLTGDNRQTESFKLEKHQQTTQDVIDRILSKQTVEKAVKLVTGDEDLRFAKSIFKRLDVSCPGDIGLIKATLRGRAYRDDAKTDTLILNEMIKYVRKSNTSVRLIVVDPASPTLVQKRSSINTADLLNGGISLAIALWMALIGFGVTPIGNYPDNRGEKNRKYGKLALVLAVLVAITGVFKLFGIMR